jgi:hypothetical protein
MTKLPSPSRQPVANSVGDLLYADILYWNVPSVSQNTYALIILDEFSNFAWFSPLRSKDAKTVADIWINLVAFLKTQTGRTVRSLQTDNGTEFINETMAAFNQANGILHRTTVPYAHEQNGRVERLNRSIGDGIRANLQTFSMPQSLWAEAGLTFVYCRNRLYRARSPSMSPYEALFSRKPDVSFLLPFGSSVVAFVHNELRSNKAQLPGVRGRVVGYKEDASFRVLLMHNKIIHSRDIKLLRESERPSQSLPYPIDTTTSQQVIPAARHSKGTDIPSGNKLHPSQLIMRTDGSHSMSSTPVALRRSKCI